MKRPIQRALFLRTVKDYAPGYDRIYCGNEFCENLIPSLAVLKRFHELSIARKIGFTFVTPFVTQAGLERLSGLLAYLNAQGPIEVVCNDWGVLSRVRRRWCDLQPVAGRLLTKQRRDPMMLPIMSNAQKVLRRSQGGRQIFVIPRDCPPALFEHHRASVVSLPLFQDFLSANRVSRVEVDNLLWDMNIDVKPGMGVSLYTPFGYIATTRMCARQNISDEPCGRKCRKQYFRLNDNSIPTPLFSCGNTVFYRSSMPSEVYLRQRHIDRIVHQPEFPF